MSAYSDALEHINSVSRNGGRPGVECTRALLDRLGSPERSLDVIHVAGTNGKGSVCAYMTGMLRGFLGRVGTFTSPHLVRENERIRINGVDIPDDAFARYYAMVHEAELGLLQEGFGQITYFDFFMGIAMLYFADEAVDVVVLETGLGGRLDSTNVFPKPLLTIITSISLDHTAILGDTVEAVAGEKAGIIKRGVPLVYLGGREYSQVLEKRAAELGCVSYGVTKSQCVVRDIGIKHIDFSLDNKYYRDTVFRLETNGVYQVENACLALMGMWCLKDWLHADDGWLGTLGDGLLGTSWNGRMQQVLPGIYLDGAHNPDGIAHFLESVRVMKGHLSGACGFGLVFAAVRDKSFDEMCRLISEAGLFDSIVVTQVGGSRRLAAQELAADLGLHGVSVSRSFGDSRRAYEYVLEDSEKSGRQWFFAGSLYLVGEIMGYVG